MRLWCDSHRPHSLQELSYNPDLTHVLQQIAAKKDFPHLLFYGPSGAGKKTRALCFLKEVFGPAVFKTRSQQRSFDEGSSKLQVTVVSSQYHIDITPADLAQQDRLVVTKLIKQMASSGTVDPSCSFKVIIINEAERLSKEAQAGLRRTMEKYMAKCRIILICQNISRLIEPIRSRCLQLRVVAPTRQEVRVCLEKVLRQEKAEFDSTSISTLVSNSESNLRSALLQAQTMKVKGRLKDYRQQASEMKLQIDKLAQDITRNPSVQKMVTVRGVLYQYLQNCFPPELVLRMIAERVVLKLKKDQSKVEVMRQAAKCERSLSQGLKAIVHLESFCCWVMVIAKGQG